MNPHRWLYSPCANDYIHSLYAPATTSMPATDQPSYLFSIGREIRARLDEHVAQLYADLDGGFTHLAWLLPGWLPLPSFRYNIR